MPTRLNQAIDLLTLIAPLAIAVLVVLARHV